MLSLFFNQLLSAVMIIFELFMLYIQQKKYCCKCSIIQYKFQLHYSKSKFSRNNHKKLVMPNRHVLAGDAKVESKLLKSANI